MTQTAAANRDSVRAAMRRYLGITIKELIAVTGLGRVTVARHVAAIKREWRNS